jgi:hypothetical protein
MLTAIDFTYRNHFLARKEGVLFSPAPAGHSDPNMFAACTFRIHTQASNPCWYQTAIKVEISETAPTVRPLYVTLVY